MKESLWIYAELSSETKMGHFFSCINKQLTGCGCMMKLFVFYFLPFVTVQVFFFSFILWVILWEKKSLRAFKVKKNSSHVSYACDIYEPTGSADVSDCTHFLTESRTLSKICHFSGPELQLARILGGFFVMTRHPFSNRTFCVALLLIIVFWSLLMMHDSQFFLCVCRHENGNKTVELRRRGCVHPPDYPEEEKLQNWQDMF